MSLRVSGDEQSCSIEEACCFKLGKTSPLLINYKAPISFCLRTYSSLLLLAKKNLKSRSQRAGRRPSQLTTQFRLWSTNESVELSESAWKPGIGSPLYSLPYSRPFIWSLFQQISLTSPWKLVNRSSYNLERRCTTRLLTWEKSLKSYVLGWAIDPYSFVLDNPFWLGILFESDSWLSGRYLSCSLALHYFYFLFISIGRPKSTYAYCCWTVNFIRVSQ